jgi:hypothetical protein
LLLTEIGCLLKSPTELTVETSLCYEAWTVLRETSNVPQRVIISDVKGFLYLVLRIDRTHPPYGELNTSYELACQMQKRF